MKRWNEACSRDKNSVWMLAKGDIQKEGGAARYNTVPTMRNISRQQEYVVQLPNIL